MQTIKFVFLLSAQAAALLFGIPRIAAAIPSPFPHRHDNVAVYWEEDGTPNGSSDHNHLTADTILVADRWDINKAWDNQDLQSATKGDTDWAHGMITAPVKYGWGALIPDAAKDAVEAAYDDWIAKAKTHFNIHRDPWDRLAIDFERDNGAGPFDITVSFVANLGSYGVFSSAAQTIRFESAPDFLLKTTGGLKQIRLGDAGVGGTEISVPVSWSYDGTPAATLTDFDYSDDGGANWTDAPPVGFGNLDWAGFGYGHLIAPADQINIFEMDFLTIARHEVGHSIALGHIGSDLSAIMREDIADFALFGNTMQIDNDSALAVAIDYTYAELTPEPSALAIAMLGLLPLGMIRRRR